jgi:flagellar basal body-associated protein FliL
MKPKHVNTLIVLAVVAGIAYGLWYMNKQKAAAATAAAAAPAPAAKTV